MTHRPRRADGGGGADHIVVGTDYPFDTGERDPAGVLGRRSLSPDERNLIESATAAKLLKLTTQQVLEPARQNADASDGCGVRAVRHAIITA